MNQMELCANCDGPTRRAGRGEDSIYCVNCGFGPFCPTCAADGCPHCHKPVYEDVELATPGSEMACRWGCTCTRRFAHSASLEPPEPRIDKFCPLHGVNPDGAALRQAERGRH
jgi:hypothetical protein